MKIWVDADAIPGPIKDIVVTAAHKRSIDCTFVANKLIALPVSNHLRFKQVEGTPDAADRFIETQAVAGDLVITQDIPLAHALVHNSIVVINPRGELFSADNIAERLSMRNLMQDIRDSGEQTGGPRQFGEREKRAFAATFDRELTRLISRKASGRN